MTSEREQYKEKMRAAGRRALEDFRKQKIERAAGAGGPASAGLVSGSGQGGAAAPPLPSVELVTFRVHTQPAAVEMGRTRPPESAELRLLAPTLSSTSLGSLPPGSACLPQPQLTRPSYASSSSAASVCATTSVGSLGSTATGYSAAPLYSAAAGGGGLGGGSSAGHSPPPSQSAAALTAEDEEERLAGFTAGRGRGGVGAVVSGGGGGDTAMVDMLLGQVEALMRDKAALASENAALRQQVEQLTELVGWLSLERGEQDGEEEELEGGERLQDTAGGFQLPGYGLEAAAAEEEERERNAPFNDWWRAELERQGRRPNAQEIAGWYNRHAAETWKEQAPSIQETRVHAKCLRSLPLVRDYFRNYRAKKRSGNERPGSCALTSALEYRDERGDSDPDADPDPDYTPASGRSLPPPLHHPLLHAHAFGARARGGAGDDDDDDGDDEDMGPGGDPEDDEDEEDDDDAVAVAGLKQLANLRHAGSPAAPEDAEVGSAMATEEDHDSELKAGGWARRGGGAGAGAARPLPADVDLGLLQAQPSLPGLAAVLGPSAAALWTAAATAPPPPAVAAALGLDPAAAAAASPQLLAQVTLQHLHQRVTFASLAQNLGLGRGSPLALQVLSQQQQAMAAGPPLPSLLAERRGSAAREDGESEGGRSGELGRTEAHAEEDGEAEGRQRGDGGWGSRRRRRGGGFVGAGAGAAGGRLSPEEQEGAEVGEGDDDNDGPAPLPDPRLVPKRRRTGGVVRRRYGGDEEAGAAAARHHPAGGDALAASRDEEPSCSGRWPSMAARAPGGGLPSWRSPRSSVSPQPQSPTAPDGSWLPGPRGRGAGTGAGTAGPARYGSDSLMRAAPLFTSERADEANLPRDGGGIPRQGDGLALPPPPLLALLPPPRPLDLTSLSLPTAQPLLLPPQPQPPVLPELLLPREALAGLSREALVERVVALQEHLRAVWDAQRLRAAQLQRLATPPREERQQLASPSPVVGRATEPAEAAAEKRSWQAAAAAATLSEPGEGAIARLAPQSESPPAGAGIVKQEVALQDATRLRPPGSDVPAHLAAAPLGRGGAGPQPAAAGTAGPPCDVEEAGSSGGAGSDGVGAGGGKEGAVLSLTGCDAMGSGDHGGSPVGPASTDGDSRLPDLASLAEAAEAEAAMH
ncbi:hypothetical protein GPECTOR_96g705 [Gonium pectorale]|uniref:Uncharacterized protein n=1 Tax=Gonium pectorale TaxID=33097 RepID=A0A150G062_GONPE|nr:hypothetical protein GPECTOR_96g705 [Gonium pectorale]|eukprot:KXZ43239.1 hypothetical protein GPECTOR_96g705 [Gonium pectorale]